MSSMELTPITLEDKALFDRYLKEYPPSASELTFTNIFCWAESKNHRFCELSDHLLISCEHDACLCFYPPVGPHPERIIEDRLPGMDPYTWVRIDKELASRLFTDAHLICDRDNSDYVYRLSNLQALQGKKYDGKRNFIKRFQTYAPRVVSLTLEHAAACLRIGEAWLEQLENPASARDEYTALSQAFNNFSILNLQGIGILVGDDLVGFAIGEPLNSSTYVEHFEKALTKFTGIYAYLLHAFATSIPPSFTYLNREQDLGIPGLRKAKESWNPEPFLVEKFTLKLKHGREP